MYNVAVARLYDTVETHQLSESVSSPQSWAVQLTLGPSRVLMHEFIAQWAFAVPASTGGLTDDAAIAAAMAAEDESSSGGHASRAAGYPVTAPVHKFRQTRPPVWSRGALHAGAPAPPVTDSCLSMSKSDSTNFPGGGATAELPMPTVALQVVSAVAFYCRLCFKLF